MTERLYFQAGTHESLRTQLLRMQQHGSLTTLVGDAFSSFSSDLFKETPKNPILDLLEMTPTIMEPWYASMLSGVHMRIPVTCTDCSNITLSGFGSRAF